MTKKQHSKRIEELTYQIEKLENQLKHSQGKSVLERIKEIKKYRDLISQYVLQCAMEASTKEEALKHLAENQNISVATKGAVLLEREIDPPPEGFLTGEDALAVVPYPSKKYYEAIRHYSADTDHPQSCYKLINTSLRKDEVLTDRVAIKVRNQLLEMFKHVPPLEKPIRLYRGIPKNVAEDVKKIGFYFDAGFGSFSSELGVAIAYSGVSKCILVLDLIPGFSELVRIGDLSRNSHEREILLKNEETLIMIDSKITEDGFNIIYLRAE